MRAGVVTLHQDRTEISNGPGYQDQARLPPWPSTP